MAKRAVVCWGEAEVAWSDVAKAAKVLFSLLHINTGYANPPVIGLHLRRVHYMDTFEPSPCPVFSAVAPPPIGRRERCISWSHTVSCHRATCSLFH